MPLASILYIAGGVTIRLIPLARAAILAELFAAVAQVLAFVLSLKMARRPERISSRRC